MSEILVLGISHYPPLTGHDARMAAILKRMLTNPKLPAHLRMPAGWPAGMREEWGRDEGTTSTARHRAALVGWMDGENPGGTRQFQAGFRADLGR